MSKDNLIPFTKETAKEAGRKGGIASGKTRRRKRDMKQAMNMLLSTPVNKANREKLKALGIDPDEADNQMLMLAVAMQKALRGDMRAIEYITELTTVNATNKAKIAVEKEKNKIMKEKITQYDKNEENEVEDDGFMDALNGLAREDWQDEAETSDI